MSALRLLLQGSPPTPARPRPPQSSVNRLRWPWLAIVREESGQDLIEYALLTALVALAAVEAMQAVAAPINNRYSVITTKFHKHIGKHLVSRSNPGGMSWTVATEMKLLSSEFPVRCLINPD